MPDPQVSVAARPVYLHVGLMKTGTSYLQTILRASKEQLVDQGLAMVPGSQRASHQLTLAVREQEGVRRGDPLERLRTQLEKVPGDRVLISEESLSAAEPAQVARLAEVLGDREVHLVVTVRDVARTLPSQWQQTVKSGRRNAYEAYAAAVAAQAESDGAPGFRRHQDVLDVLDRWGSIAPPERTHVVVVPSPGSPPDALLERFCSVVGIDPATLTRDVARANESLGAAESEVLRRVNDHVAGRYGRVDYGDVFKRYLALKVLVPQGGRRLLVPAEYRAWCETEADRVVTTLGGRGYVVVGDLDELRPPASAFTDADQSATEDEVARSAVAALATVLADRIEKDREAEEADAPTPGEQGSPSDRTGRAERVTQGVGGLAGKVKRRLRRLRPA